MVLFPVFLEHRSDDGVSTVSFTVHLTLGTDSVFDLAWPVSSFSDALAQVATITMGES